MEALDKTTLDRFVESISPPIIHDHENRKYFAEFGDDYTNPNKKEFESHIPPIPQSKISITSSNNTTDTDNEVHDDPKELTAMREKLQDLVSKEVKSRGMNINIPPQNQLPKYTDDPKENHIISLINQQSLKDVIHTITRSQQSQNQIHPAVQKLYEQQQQLLEKLQLLEKDDPDPSGAKLWNIMQRIFTEENVAERQRNIEDLKSTLDEKHREVTELDLNEEKNERSLLRSIHEMSKDTKNELKQMRQQLDEERKINQELRQKIRRKNRQLKLFSNKKETENANYTTAPMVYDPIAYDPDGAKGGRRTNLNVSVDSLEFDSDYMEEYPSSFGNWCIDMGLQSSKTKCSWC